MVAVYVLSAQSHDATQLGGVSHCFLDLLDDGLALGVEEVDSVPAV
jgi:hypothetical protein